MKRLVPNTYPHSSNKKRLKGKKHVFQASVKLDSIVGPLHVAECPIRSPASLALFLQAANNESLEPGGGIAAGRILI